MGNRLTRTDYHVHTCYSHDCGTPVDVVVDTALKIGLTEIAITDHDTIAGGIAAERYAQGKPIRVIVGAEISTDKGEIIGLNLKEEIVERRLEQVIRAIKAQGGQVLVPHPCGLLRRHRLRVPLDELADQLDYIEVYNGRTVFGGDNRKVLEIATRYKIKISRGSDAHFAFEIGNTGGSVINWRGQLGYLLTAVYKRLYRRPKNTVKIE